MGATYLRPKIKIECTHYRIAGNFRWVLVSLRRAQNEKLTHKNLYTVRYYDDVLRAYNENKITLSQITLSRPNNENYNPKRKFPTIRALGSMF